MKVEPWLRTYRPDLICPECGREDNVIESVDKDQIDWQCLCTTARCIKCKVFWSIPIPYMRRAYKAVISKCVCCHQWTDLYTDRDSPQSYESGQYRGFKVVGRRCVKCGLTEPSEREGEV